MLFSVLMGLAATVEEFEYSCRLGYPLDPNVLLVYCVDYYINVMRIEKSLISCPSRARLQAVRRKATSFVNTVHGRVSVSFGGHYI